MPSDLIEEMAYLEVNFPAEEFIHTNRKPWRTLLGEKVAKGKAPLAAESDPKEWL